MNKQTVPRLELLSALLLAKLITSVAKLLEPVIEITITGWEHFPGKDNHADLSS